MARQHVRTPASKGGSANIKKHDEFTLDKLLDDMAKRRQEESASDRRDKTFSSAFKSMMGSPQDYTDAQDKEYERQNQKYASDLWKGEMDKAEERKNELLMEPYRAEVERQNEQAFDAMAAAGATAGSHILGYGGNLDEWLEHDAPPELLSDDADRYAQQMRNLDNLPMESIQADLLKALGRPTYKDSDLIESGYGITQEDLDAQKQWWREEESGKSFRRTDADWEEYSRIQDLVEEAKRYIDK